MGTITEAHQHMPDDPPVNFDDVIADYVGTLDWHLKLARYTGALRFGDPNGAMVSRRYVQRQARATLLAAINCLKPDITRDYLTPEFDRIVNTAGEARRRWLDAHDEPPVGAGLADIEAWADRLHTDPEVHAANAAWVAHESAWRARNGLTDEWFAQVAYEVGRFADGLQRHGIEAPEPLPLVIPDLDRYMDRYGKPWVPPRKPKNPFSLISTERKGGTRDIWLDDLKHPPIEYEHGELEDEGDFAEYDPSTDNVTDAITRIMPELERRLRRVLEAIDEEERRLNDVVEPVRTHTRGFVWAARCLVGGESRNGIAAADGIDRATISREVAEVECLAGIAIPRNAGGRPSKPRANTKRVR